MWRRLERINWMDKKSNEEVLIMVNENRCLIRTMYQRKKNWIGHVLRLLRDCLGMCWREECWRRGREAGQEEE